LLGLAITRISCVNDCCFHIFCLLVRFLFNGSVLCFGMLESQSKPFTSSKPIKHRFTQTEPKRKHNFSYIQDPQLLPIRKRLSGQGKRKKYCIIVTIEKADLTNIFSVRKIGFCCFQR